jgi:hypothetical protein
LIMTLSPIWIISERFRVRTSMVTLLNAVERGLQRPAFLCKFRLDSCRIEAASNHRRRSGEATIVPAPARQNPISRNRLPALPLLGRHQTSPQFGLRAFVAGPSNVLTMTTRPMWGRSARLHSTCNLCKCCVFPANDYIEALSKKQHHSRL